MKSETMADISILNSNLFVLYIHLIWLQCAMMHIASLMVIRSGSHTMQRDYHLKLRYVLCSQIINRNVTILLHMTLSTSNIWTITKQDKACFWSGTFDFRLRKIEVLTLALCMTFTFLLICMAQSSIILLNHLIQLILTNECATSLSTTTTTSNHKVASLYQKKCITVFFFPLLLQMAFFSFFILLFTTFFLRTYWWVSRRGIY